MINYYKDLLYGAFFCTIVVYFASCAWEYLSLYSSWQLINYFVASTIKCIFDDFVYLISTLFFLCKQVISTTLVTLFKCWRILLFILVFKSIYDKLFPVKYPIGCKKIWVSTDEINNLQQTIKKLKQAAKQKQLRNPQITTDNRESRSQMVVYRQQNQALKYKINILLQLNKEMTIKQQENMKKIQNKNKKIEAQLKQTKKRSEIQKLYMQKQINIYKQQTGKLNQKVQTLQQSLHLQKTLNKSLTELITKNKGKEQKKQQKAASLNEDKLRDLQKQIMKLSQINQQLQKQLKISYEYQECLEASMNRILTKTQV